MSSSLKDAKVENTAAVSQQENETRPWYSAGGMIVNLVGIEFNIILPLYAMVSTTSTKEQHQFYVLLICFYIVAALTTSKSKTLYCIMIVPTYMASLFVLPTLVQYSTSRVLQILAVSSILASVKINICMSVCMHRYASHKAFKCGPIMNVFLCFLGCLANQGGPLWWSSQHRCHHKLRINSLQ
jgi:hypothetical protein